MKQKFIITLPFVLFLFTCSAQWSTNSAINNAICTVNGHQIVNSMIIDDVGGAFIAWADFRGGNTSDIYVQHINANGLALWNVVVCNSSGSQGFANMISDGNKGVIITWADQRSGNWDTYAQKVDSFGVPQWTANGVLICNAMYDQFIPTIVPSSLGSAIISWGDYRNGDVNIYAQKINSNGVTQWTANGILICDAIGQSYPEMIPDESGGSILTWRDFRNGNYDIFTQKINSNGVTQWTANGVLICNASNHQLVPKIASDYSNGAMVTWVDGRNGTYDIYAQKINSNGVTQWTTNGVVVCSSVTDQNSPKIITDVSKGAIIVWEDLRSSEYDIYCQKIDSNGLAQWTSNGIPICTFTGDQKSPGIISDGNGGSFITWEDSRNWVTGVDIYTQKINANGIIQWLNNGVAISTIVNDQNHSFMIPNNQGGAIIAWNDWRTSELDIYAQRVNSNGTLLCTTSPSNTNISVCSSELPYYWNTQTIITSGTYYFTSINTLGCDSVTILHLSVNNATSATTSISACDSYLWNGSTYTTSGVYTQTSMNANTCLHTDTILLTILPHPTVNLVSNQTYCALQLTQPLTLSGTPYGVNFNISGGAARGLANQIGVSSVPSFTALSGTSIVTITPIANGCIGTSTNYTLAISNCPPITLNLKFYIQGYYQGAGLMNPVMFNQGIITDPISNQVDNVIVELHSATSPFGMIKTTIATLNRNGTLTCSFNGSVTNTPYYIVIHHRNSVVTWSSVPVVMIPNATYDFSAMASNAFGNNQVDVSTNGSIWAFYTGDVNQDENVDLLDLAYLESDITSFEFGYQISDLNGDGNVDLLDNPLLEINSSDFIFSEHP